MSENPEGSVPSTPESVKAVAQTKEGGSAEEVAAAAPPPPQDEWPAECAGRGKRCEIGKGVERAVEGQWKEREGDKPIYRPLKIFALDPSVSKLEGAKRKAIFFGGDASQHNFFMMLHEEQTPRGAKKKSGAKKSGAKRRPKAS